MNPWKITKSAWLLPFFAAVLMWGEQEPFPEQFHKARIVGVEYHVSRRLGGVWAVHASLLEDPKAPTVKLSRLRKSSSGRPLLKEGEEVCLASAVPILRPRMYWETVPYKCK